MVSGGSCLVAQSCGFVEVADFALDSNYHQPGDFISNLNVGAFITNTKVALSPSLLSQKIKVPETTNSGGKS